ncbi:toll/interleukin-1 receptor domain-containing protein [Peteryoungia algae]|uniref:Toll/interleukin-1 receptor domain-containing protein n=1 Tax=Peteryoungia algae TaxID=2919917 RepID=A0ABT0D270_9HYPH|nr:toll/interleukin-1 receptor domain-containing protein [Rhizobium sp. SSM4.3]MCJ8239508.1 toll/interleukin-1 receptor domain-containing protein [Rhizobium sp. SSM4.3]
MSVYSYQVITMGAHDDRLTALKVSVEKRATDLGINPRTIAFVDCITDYDRKLPAIGIYFGNTLRGVPHILDKILEDSIIVAPVVSDKTKVTDEIPSELTHINVIECSASGAGIARLTSLIFETFRLLRKERGVFISYRRKGSQPLADKLYEDLDKRGFDVFIDVRSVPPAVDFQAELWHRMSDVDVIVLIDTPGFREGRWTSAELAQANLLGIQTLHLLWPGQTEDAKYAFSHFVKLQVTDFSGPSPGRGGTITKKAVDQICNLAEELRAKAMALRHAHLVDNFCDAARDLRFNPSVQPERWISVELANKKTLAAVPTIGRPTSDRINTIFESISSINSPDVPIWAVYDSRGLHKDWLTHLKWLDGHLPIRTISVADIPQALKEFVR